MIITLIQPLMGKLMNKKIYKLRKRVLNEAKLDSSAILNVAKKLIEISELARALSNKMTDDKSEQARVRALIAGKKMMEVASNV